MRIAGIDPDTKSITIYIVSTTHSDDRIRIQAKGRRAEDRFLSLVEDILEATCNHDRPPLADYVYIERPFVGPNRKAAIDMGMVVGALRGALVRAEVPHSLVDPAVWKTNTMGTSNVSKEEIKQWAMVRFKLPGNLEQDHYDAACIAAYGMQVMGGK